MDNNKEHQLRVQKMFEDQQNLKKYIRKLKREKASGGMGMNSLMDIMTILLIFLLKSFSNKADSIQMSKELQLPKSTGLLKLEQTIKVYVMKNSITVEKDGKGRKVVLQNAMVDDADMLNGDPNTHVIATLKDILEEKAEYLKDLERQSNGKRKFKGVVTIIADKTIPYRVINDVVQTSAISQFKKVKFAVIQGS